MLGDVCLTFLLEMVFDGNQNILLTKMLVRHRLTRRLHVLTLLNQKSLCDNVRTCSQGIRSSLLSIVHCLFNVTVPFIFPGKRKSL